MNRNNTVVLYVLIGVIIFFLFIMPCLDNNENFDIPTNTNNGPDHISDNIDTKDCSQSCCKFTQWLPPDMQNNDPKYKDYVGSNFSCNSGYGGGCVCTKKEDLEYLNKKADNRSQSCDNL